jgi:hypothetical protein
VKRLLPTNLKNKLQDERPVRLYGCQNNLPLYEMIVLYDGRAVMCCQDMGREHIIVNVVTDGIAAIWNGDVRVKTVKRLYNGSKNSALFLCSKCEYALTASEMITAVFSKAIGKLKSNEFAVPCEV